MEGNIFLPNSFFDFNSYKIKIKRNYTSITIISKTISQLDMELETFINTQKKTKKVGSNFMRGMEVDAFIYISFNFMTHTLLQNN